MLDSEPQRHKMVLVATHEEGNEEWSCPTCGRRFLTDWPPEYKKVIIEVGDENASHSGGKGMPGAALDLDTAQIEPGETTPRKENSLVVENYETDENSNPVQENDALLAPWVKWMKQVNF